MWDLSTVTHLLFSPSVLILLLCSCFLVSLWFLFHSRTYFKLDRASAEEEFDSQIPENGEMQAYANITKWTGKLKYEATRSSKACCMFVECPSMWTAVFAVFRISNLHLLEIKVLQCLKPRYIYNQIYPIFFFRSSVVSSVNYNGNWITWEIRSKVAREKA